MNAAKRLKKEEVESSSSEDEIDEDFSLEPVGSDEIKIDLVGFPLSDDDFDGIHQFLQQLFTDDCRINLEQLTDNLISQNFIGSVMKLENEDSSEQSESEELDDVFAVVTCYPLTRPKDSLCDSISKYLLDKCNSSNAKPATKEIFEKVLKEYVKESSSISVGLLISERFINCPAQCVLPMYNALLDEIAEAKTRQHKARFDFARYLVVCKACNVNVQNSLQTLYANAEEELFAEQAKASFTYSVKSNSEMTQRRVLLLNEEGFRTSIAKMKESF